MFLKKISVSGGDPRELQAVFSDVPGIVDSFVGTIQADEECIQGLDLHFDPKRIDISMILDLLFAVVDPHLPDGQGNWRGPAYRAGVWYEDEEDLPQLELYMNFLRNRGKSPAVTNAKLTINDPNTTKKVQHCYAGIHRQDRFTPAPDNDQHYYETHDTADTYIDFDKLRAYLKYSWR